MIRVLIADDHHVMRAGLRQFLSLQNDICVEAEAEDGNQVLETLRAIPVDLLLLDMRMPGLNGEGLISRITALYPKVSILVLSMYEETQIASRALRAGARGYTSKNREPASLLIAIRQVAAGEQYVDPVLAQRISAERLAHAGACRPIDNLTAREFQILRLLAQGATVNLIAEQLVISNKTVSTHKMRLMDKMGFISNADLVKYAMQENLI